MKNSDIRSKINWGYMNKCEDYWLKPMLSPVTVTCVALHRLSARYSTQLLMEIKERSRVPENESLGNLLKNKLVILPIYFC